jgi:hypothetical protein
MHTTAKEHTMINPAAIKRWLTEQDSYTYKPDPATIEVIADPQVSGTWAVQFTDLENADTEGGVVQLLFVTGWETSQHPGAPAEQILDATLEEVEFESWPPRSGSLRFFV